MLRTGVVSEGSSQPALSALGLTVISFGEKLNAQGLVRCLHMRWLQSEVWKSGLSSVFLTFLFVFYIPSCPSFSALLFSFALVFSYTETFKLLSHFFCVYFSAICFVVAMEIPFDVLKL